MDIRRIIQKIGIDILVIILTTVGMILIGTLGQILRLSETLTIGATIIAPIITIFVSSRLLQENQQRASRSEAVKKPSDATVHTTHSAKEKKTSAIDVGSPERWATFFTSIDKLGLSYERLRKLSGALIILFFFLFLPFAISSITHLSLQIDGLKALQPFQPLSSLFISKLGLEFMLISSLILLLFSSTSFAAYMALGEIYERTTCVECNTDYCLSFDYVLYHPASKTPVTEPIKNDDGVVTGERTIGHEYTGTLYATCKETGEQIERPDWRWFEPQSRSRGLLWSFLE